MLCLFQLVELYIDTDIFVIFLRLPKVAELLMTRSEAQSVNDIWRAQFLLSLGPVVQFNWGSPKADTTLGSYWFPEHIQQVMNMNNKSM